MTAVALFAAGASVATAWCAVLITRLTERAHTAGVRAGQVEQLEELDRLVEIDPSLSVGAVRDHLDALHTRAVVAAAHKEHTR